MIRELFRNRITGQRKTQQEWFREYPKERYLWNEWKSENLVSELEEDVRFALGLGMTIIFGQNKIPLRGRKFKGRDYVPPTEREIIDGIRYEKFMIGAEMARSNMMALDYDRQLRESDLVWPFREETLRNMTPHDGTHLLFWNDVFHVRIPRSSDYQGPPLKIGHSKWLKEWRNENPGLLDALFSECDIVRIRNEISWIPPSQIEDGSYRWREPRVPPMLFSELLISLSKGRRK